MQPDDVDILQKASLFFKISFLSFYILCSYFLLSNQ